jgi:hypothetical protein
MRQSTTDGVIFLGIIAIMVLISLLQFGCRSSHAYSYYESGQMASAAYSEGMVEWSDGAGKIMPFGSINVSGVGVGK